MKKKIVFHIQVFHKGDDSFVRDIDFNEFPLREMRALFNVNDDLYMSYCYPITVQQKHYIEKYIDETLDLDKYEYFVTGSAPLE